jgi:hypothetical protein
MTLPCCTKLFPKVFKFLEGHDLHLGPFMIQRVKRTLVRGVPEVVEAGVEDGEAHIAVSGQEPGHLVHTFRAGAPGYPPGDLAVLLRIQHVLMEPVEEAEFCVEVCPGIVLFCKDPTVRGSSCCV